MIPLNKINDHDKVLPVKIEPFDPRVCLPPDYKAYNKAIDQYNQVMIDGDVEKLAEIIYLQPTDNCTVFARFVIANLDKWLVLKKK